MGRLLEYNLENENALFIEMRKHFAEEATERSSSNLCFADFPNTI